MSITSEQAQGKVPVTIFSIQDALDAANYQELMQLAKDAYAAGARAFLLDMTGTKFMSSSGMVALHSIALLLRGQEPPDLAHGWEALRSLSRDMSSGMQPGVKILNPQPHVERTLKITGMINFFEVFTDREAAIQSFE